MVCAPTNACTELEFVTAVNINGRSSGECIGPLVMIVLPLWRIYVLECIFASTSAADTMWSGFFDDTRAGSAFRLCAAHWLDLGCLAWSRAHQRCRPDWKVEAVRLLADLCRGTQWDPKEIANMFAWQRTRLT